MRPAVIIIVFSFFLLNSGGNLLASSSTSTAKEMGKQFSAVNKTAGYEAPTDPRIVAANTIKTVLNFLGIIFLCFIVYAGFLWMTAGGSEEGIEKSKKILYRSVIGLIIIIASYSITWAAFKIALNYSDKDTSGFYMLPPS